MFKALDNLIVLLNLTFEVVKTSSVIVMHGILHSTIHMCITFVADELGSGTLFSNMLLEHLVVHIAPSMFDATVIRAYVHTFLSTVVL